MEILRYRDLVEEYVSGLQDILCANNANDLKEAYSQLLELRVDLEEGIYFIQLPTFDKNYIEEKIIKEDLLNKIRKSVNGILDMWQDVGLNYSFDQVLSRIQCDKESFELLLNIN